MPQLSRARARLAPPSARRPLPRPRGIRELAPRRGLVGLPHPGRAPGLRPRGGGSPAGRPHPALLLPPQSPEHQYGETESGYVVFRFCTGTGAGGQRGKGGKGEGVKGETCSPFPLSPLLPFPRFIAVSASLPPPS